MIQNSYACDKAHGTERLSSSSGKANNKGLPQPRDRTGKKKETGKERKGTKRKKEYPPNWDPDQTLPLDLPPCVVEIDGVVTEIQSYELAFAEAVDAAYSRPGVEVKLYEPESGVMVFTCPDNVALKIRIE